MNSDIDEIIPHLFISNWFTSNNIDIIKKYNIKAVITVETSSKPVDILNYYKNNNIDFMHIYLYDAPNAPIHNFFDESYNFIKKHISKHENVLVHCFAGISRSSTIILNYIIKDLYRNDYDRIRYENPNSVLLYVLNYAMSKRNIINPNNGFVNQLLTKMNEYKYSKF
jgi:protein-tyrosine phosphatase